MGEFGAEVIKVEQPGAGDPLRTWGDRKDEVGLVWKSMSRNKRRGSPPMCSTRRRWPREGVEW